MSDVSLQRLQKLASALCLRRPKEVATLTDSYAVSRYVILNAAESEIYEATKLGTLDFIEHAIADAEKRGSAYLSAFQRINDLRYICNHGVAPVREKHRRNVKYEEDVSKNGLNFQQQLDQLLCASVLVCVVCGSDLEDATDLDNLTVGRVDRLRNARQQLCATCVMDPLANASPASASTPASSDPDSSTLEAPAPFISSKVQTLVQYIQQTAPADQCAVFSYWTSTLDLIQYALDQASISSCRYDGRLTRPKRDNVLAKFATPTPRIKAILVSITCGGQGLDITAANHAILFEPQWNPMLEEQALSRVHRIGQLKPVYLVRFVVKGSWEENIVSVQERKRTLADLIVGEKKLKKGDEGKKLLLHLRELVG